MKIKLLFGLNFFNCKLEFRENFVLFQDSFGSHNEHLIEIYFKMASRMSDFFVVIGRWNLFLLDWFSKVGMVELFSIKILASIKPN